jgi:hypothetical protein
MQRGVNHVEFSAQSDGGLYSDIPADFKCNILGIYLVCCFFSEVFAAPSADYPPVRYSPLVDRGKLDYRQRVMDEADPKYSLGRAGLGQLKLQGLVSCRQQSSVLVGYFNPSQNV